MLLVVLAVGQLALADIFILLLQIVAGVAVYFLGSMLLKLPPYRQLLSTLKKR